MSTTAVRDLYEILGVPETASQDEIRQAYLKLAKKYHPDKTGGDKDAEQKLKEINGAYDTLKNSEKRRQYDESRANPFANAGRGAGFEGFTNAQGFGNGGGFGFGGGFADAFSDIFGGWSPRRTGPRRGSDIEVELSVTLRDVLKGAKKTIRVPRRATCQTCNGSGAEPGTKPQPCTECNGSGHVSRGNGAYVIQTACPRCGGQGQVITNPCKACRGSGHTAKPRTLSVNIPAGAESGMRLCLRGQGNDGEPDAPSGDLYVAINVKKHELFERSGKDVTIEAPVPFTDAALGAKVRVPTLRGSAELRIPAGTQSGARFRLRGQGLPAAGGSGQGDQYVRVVVEIPAKLTSEQRELLEKFAASAGPEAYPKRHNFLDKLKGKFAGWAAAAACLLSLRTLAG